MNTFTLLHRTEYNFWKCIASHIFEKQIGARFLNFFLLFLDSISETPQFVLSKQGKTQLVDSGGNIYYKHKGSQNNGKTSWKCTSYFKTKCKASFTTDDTSLCVLKSNKEHNHWAENSKKKGLETIMNTFTRLQRTEIRIQFDKERKFLKI